MVDAVTAAVAARKKDEKEEAKSKSKGKLKQIKKYSLMMNLHFSQEGNSTVSTLHFMIQCRLCVQCCCDTSTCEITSVAMQMYGAVTDLFVAPLGPSLDVLGEHLGLVNVDPPAVPRDPERRVARDERRHLLGQLPRPQRDVAHVV